jgi:hypothetical protein
MESEAIRNLAAVLIRKTVILKDEIPTESSMHE